MYTIETPCKTHKRIKYTMRAYCIPQGTLFSITWQPGWEERLREIGYTYVCLAEYLCCWPETITASLIGYVPIQNKSIV